MGARRSRVDFNGPSAAEQGLVKSPQPHLRCRQVLMRRREIGSDPQRSLTAEQCFLRAPQLQVELAEIVMRLGKLRIDFECTPVMACGLLEPAEACQCVAQIDVRGGILWSALHCPGEGIQCVLSLSGTGET